MKRIALLLLLVLSCVIRAADVRVSFARGAWNPEQWMLVRTFRWEDFSSWIQEDDCIRNVCPSDCPPEDLISKRAPETYISMLWKEPLAKSARTAISATLSFHDRMSAEISLIPAPRTNAKGNLVSDEWWEIVLYNKGINVWHLRQAEGKAVIRRIAFVEHAFTPGRKYKLDVTLAPHWTKVPSLTVKCDGVAFGCAMESLPETFHAGVTACEGTIRFYDFSLKTR